VGIGLNFVGIDPIKALIYSAVANGVVAPVALFFIVRMSGDKKVMGEHINSKTVTILGWITIIVMAAAGIGALWSLF
jgi:Mn2+/Fe2+ NRAMP family transporter